MGAGRLRHRARRFRGAGARPAISTCGRRASQDLHDMLWSGPRTQSWSNGKVESIGISYYAMNQWHVAPLRPPHLAALCIWEGSSDYYRELARHGGILCDFLKSWSERQVTNVQYGVGEPADRKPVTGEPVAGPETLRRRSSRRNRADVAGEAFARR